MKFENLYRFIINEAEAIEDIQELDADLPAATPAEKTPDQMTDDEKVDFLVQNSKIIQTGKGGVKLSPTEAIKKAKDAIDNGYFEALYDGVKQRESIQADVGGTIASPEAEVDELEGEDVIENPDLEAETEYRDEDMGTIKTGLSQHKKLRGLESEGEEEFGGQEI